MKLKSSSSIRALSLCVGAVLLWTTQGFGDPEEFSFRYGPEGNTLTMRKSSDYMAVKPSSIATTGDVREFLGDEANRVGSIPSLGGFSVLKVDRSKVEDTNSELDRLRKFSTIQIGSHVFHTGSDKVPFVPTGQIHVKFKQDASDDECTEALERAYLQIFDVKGPRELMVGVTANSSNPIKAAQQLQRIVRVVEFAEPDFATQVEHKVFQVPTDPLFRAQWHLQNTGFNRGTTIGSTRGADARVVEGWEALDSYGLNSYGSDKVIVAVIDDGFDLDHPDLLDRAPDGSNRKIVKPWDFARNNNDPRPVARERHEDGSWHGTACAGVAVGRLEGGHIVGAAPNAKLMPLRMGNSLSGIEVAKWFNHAAANGADVISCSWGALAHYFPISNLTYNAIHNAATNGRNGKGCVIAFAAGNESRDVNNLAGGSINGFAIHPDVIAVAASTSRDMRSPYSNYGREISICAPSNGGRGDLGILTSDVRGQYTMGGEIRYAGYAPGDYDYNFGGTSSACPLVAGVSALVLSANPDLTSRQVKDILQKSARKIGGATGFSSQFGHGCVNAGAAVKLAKTMRGGAVPAHHASGSEGKRAGGEHESPTGKKSKQK